MSLVTLGVADLARSKRFYEALGWQAHPGDDGVVFFQTGGIVVALWGRSELAEDSAVVDSGGWGGVTLAHNVRSPAEVDELLAAADAAGATIGRSGAATFWGGHSGLHRSGWSSLGDRAQSVLDHHGRRPDAAERGRRLNPGRLSGLESPAGRDGGAERSIGRLTFSQ